jgi:hypothetical protein
LLKKVTHAEPDQGLGWLILGEAVTVEMAVAGVAVLTSVAIILRAGSSELAPGRGMFRREATAPPAPEPVG